MDLIAINNSPEEELEEVKVLKKAAESKLLDISRRETALKEKIFAQKTGLAIGTKVEYKGKKAIISGYYTPFKDVSPIVTFFQKDGHIGKNQSIIYSFDFNKLKIID